MHRRPPHQIRPVSIQRAFTKTSPGSVLYSSGDTLVLCTASVDENLPPWLADQQKGWLTAEYNMLPGSTSPRKSRDRGVKIDGRTTEIQRLIGRTLRAIVNLHQLGPRQITLDCDVLQADGGTRTACITGAFVALVDALHHIQADLPDPQQMPLRDSIAAISVGIVDGQCVVDLDYRLDYAATVDLNLVMTGSGAIVEIQGTGEEATFSEDELAKMLKLAKQGIAELTDLQRAALGDGWPV